MRSPPPKLTPAAPPVVAVVGPTAVGKTRLAISLARRFNGEIVNADSRQVYRLMSIGTAKPMPAERAEARHHLVDILDPNESFGLGLFLKLAHDAIGDIATRGRLPIVSGGTGQYVWGLLEGRQVPEVPPDPAFRQRLEQMAAEEGGEALHARLQEVDPDRAAALDPRNVRRVIRALEIHQATGRKPSNMGKREALPFPTLVIGLTMERQELYRRIDARVDDMMAEGLLEEVRKLAAEGYAPGQGALGSPGYRELGEYLSGQTGLDEAVRRTKTQTHRMARRQYTWFKPSDLGIHWLDAAGANLDEAATALVDKFLHANPPVLQ